MAEFEKFKINQSMPHTCRWHIHMIVWENGIAKLNQLMYYWNSEYKQIQFTNEKERVEILNTAYIGKKHTHIFIKIYIIV